MCSIGCCVYMAVNARVVGWESGGREKRKGATMRPETAGVSGGFPLSPVLVASWNIMYTY